MINRTFNQQKDNLINLLRATKEVLDKYDVEFWLDAGTLLGAVRNGKFISWEHDIDLGVWSDRISEGQKMSISKELCNKGFKVWVAEDHINIKKVAEFWLDIDFYYLKKDKAIRPELYPKNLIGKFLCILSPILSSPYHPRNTNLLKSPIRRIIIRALINISQKIPSFLRKKTVYVVSAIYKKIGSKDASRITLSKYFRDLSTIKFYGMEFRIPADAEEYLSYRYGKNWRIPRKDWITERDDGAVIKFLSKPVIKSSFKNKKDI